MTFYYTIIKMAKIQKLDNTKCWWGCKVTELLFTAGGSEKIMYMYTHTHILGLEKLVHIQKYF